MRDNIEYTSRLIDALGEKIQTESKKSSPAHKDAGTQPSQNSSLTGTRHLQTDMHGDQSEQSLRDPMYRMAQKLEALVSRLNKDSFSMVSMGYILN